ncbi:NB-ARC domain-containing protein [Laspinema olomoucense]|uniref:NB-ARC domain-containing protein n=1 Tax=Laspinema olomoucense TaxID=3231600 RepID=UPI0021BA7D29|nr:NB-ARC domain-containing protein [Laspinema sp. D3d]MCT7973760.1 NB-ARC domain-containing protein [Laspinema sp. D3d]
MPIGKFMNLKEMLNFADRIVFEKTARHLDDLQEAVLQGTLHRETYKQIAKEFDYSESSVRNAGSELWQILSEELGEDVSKTNFRSTMERLHNSNVLFAQDVVVTGSFNICSDAKHPPDIPPSPPQNQANSNNPPTQASHHDLSEMPELGAFYSRSGELETLKIWIVQQRCRLVALTGMGGIGKTSLAVQLVQQIKDEFESVVWCSLTPSLTFSEFQERLIQFFCTLEYSESLNAESKPLGLIKYLQKHRCLVVLDDVHHLFSNGELAGKYQEGNEDYRSFLQQVEKLSHQSCFLLIGWEPPRELAPNSRNDGAIQILQLGGLDEAGAWEILRDYGVPEVEKDSALIQRYQGNPFWLKSVATLIHDLGESVSVVLLDDTILLPQVLKESLHQQWHRLSELEQEVMFQLAEVGRPVSLSKLIQTNTLDPTDVLNGLHS